ncbi:MAG: YihY/virulence factor BrkB family protein [Syntrophobacterales bacterium]|nr:YihY/virulence factor BrkB family protein [Syntrophobacterales bacterium]
MESLKGRLLRKIQGGKLSRLFLGVQRLWRLFYLTLWKFGRDSCFDRSASLAFATIISLIPFSVLFVSFVGLLGGGEHIMRYVHQKILPAIAPEFQDEIIDWLQSYISPTAFKAGPAGLINLVAVIGLFMGALNILVTAERVFNQIWRTKTSRPYFQKATAFWVLLTSSPFLILASISIGNLIAPPGGAIEVFMDHHWWARITYKTVMPVIVETACFALMYFYLPSTRVRALYASIAGLWAAVLWELTKRAFYLYVSHALNIINFYKQIATVPLFFIWIFITWLIILWGCQLSYALQHRELLERFRKRGYHDEESYSSFFLGLFILFKLYEHSIGLTKCPPSVDDMTKELDILSTDRFEKVIESLVSNGFIVEDGRNPGRYFLARHPSLIFLTDILLLLYEQEFPAEAKKIMQRASEKDSLATTSLADVIVRKTFDQIMQLYLGKTIEGVWKEMMAEKHPPPLQRLNDLRSSSTAF